jgi:hypothetical protein
MRDEWTNRYLYGFERVYDKLKNALSDIKQNAVFPILFLKQKQEKEAIDYWIPSLIFKLIK